MKLTTSAFAAKWSGKTGRFKDNDNFEVDEADLRDFAQDLLDSGLLDSPNRQPGFWKAFRFLTGDEIDANGGYGEAYDELVFTSCCIQTRVYVEFYQPDLAVAGRRNVVLCAVYDPAAPPDHQVYVDGSFRPGDLVPVRFVPVDDPAALYGYVRPYDPALVWRSGEQTIYTENGQTYFARSKRAGLLGQPLSSTDTTDWKREPTPTPTLGLTGRAYQTEAQWQYLLDNSRVAPGQPYTLEWGGGLLLVDGGVDSDGFASTGELWVAGAGGTLTKQAVQQVDVAAGTYQVLGQGGQYQGDARGAVAYRQHDLVTQSYLLYAARQDFTTDRRQFNEADWVRLVRAETLLELLDVGACQAGGIDAVVQDDKLILTIIAPGNGNNAPAYAAGPGIAISGQNVISTAIAQPSSTRLTFAQDAEYQPVLNGTFTVDATGAQVGRVVFAYLGPGASAPSIGSGFQLLSGSYQAGANLMYAFKVGSNGFIQYTITVLP